MVKIIGEILKKKREDKKLTYEEIHNDTYISKSYLAALEDGNIDEFPAEVYYLGFLKRYATYLRLNPDELVSMYYNSIKQQAEEAGEKTEQLISHDYKPFLIIAVLVLIALAAFFIYTNTLSHFKNRIADDKTAQEQANGSSAAQVSAPLVMEIEVIKDSWIKVLSDDKQLFQGILLTGAKQSWTGQNKIKLIVGYTTGVRVKLNGKPVDITKGAKQEVNEITFTLDDVNRNNSAQ